MNAPIAIGANRVRIRMSRRVVICMGLGGYGGGVNKIVGCYFTDHSESLDLTINLSSPTFDNGQRKATVLVPSLYLGLAPDPCRAPPLPIFSFCIFFAIFCHSVISKIRVI
jgi:hypothetical protein